MTLHRSGLNRGAGLQASRAKQRRGVPTGVRGAVVGRERGVCRACLCKYTTTPDMLSLKALRGLRARGTVHRAVQLHHLLPVRYWPELEREPRNLVALCAGCHDDHERAHVRLRWEWLPQECRVWLLEQARRDGGVAAYLDRTYPT